MTINRTPDNRTLKQFAVVSLLGLLALAAVAAWSWQTPLLAAALGLVGLGICSVGLVRPSSIEPVFVGLSVITHPIGWAVTHVLLAIAYFLILAPVGLVFRVFGRDALERKWDRNAGSYWQPRNIPSGPDCYFRQF